MKTIRLTRGRAATVSALDFPALQRHKWYTQVTDLPTITKYYAASKIDGKEILMHRFLTQALPGQSVDHINGNGLDNRRGNLRVCSHQENMANKQPGQADKKTSRYKGVYRTGKKWRACISIHTKTKALGTYDTEEKAALAYDQAATEAWGSWARPNFPQEGESAK